MKKIADYRKELNEFIRKEYGDLTDYQCEQLIKFCPSILEEFDR